jgi:hypothetical protein
MHRESYTATGGSQREATSLEELDNYAAYVVTGLDNYVNV